MSCGNVCMCDDARVRIATEKCAVNHSSSLRENRGRFPGMSQDWVPVDRAVVREWCTAATSGEALAQRGSSLEHAPVLPPGGKLRAIQSTGVCHHS